MSGSHSCLFWDWLWAIWEIRSVRCGRRVRSWRSIYQGRSWISVISTRATCVCVRSWSSSWSVRKTVLERFTVSQNSWIRVCRMRLSSMRLKCSQNWWKQKMWHFTVWWMMIMHVSFRHLRKRREVLETPSATVKWRKSMMNFWKKRCISIKRWMNVIRLWYGASMRMENCRWSLCSGA